MALFREMNPRKAAYGFTASLHGDNVLSVAGMILRVLGPKPVKGRWFIEMPVNMGNAELKVYIDDVGLYEEFKGANAA